MKLREIGSVLILVALALYAIHTLGHKKSSDDDGVKTRIEINSDVVNINDGLFDIEMDDLEND